MIDSDRLDRAITKVDALSARLDEWGPEAREASAANRVGSKPYSRHHENEAQKGTFLRAVHVLVQKARGSPPDDEERRQALAGMEAGKSAEDVAKALAGKGKK